MFMITNSNFNKKSFFLIKKINIARTTTDEPSVGSPSLNETYTHNESFDGEVCSFQTSKLERIVDKEKIGTALHELCIYTMNDGKSFSPEIENPKLFLRTSWEITRVAQNTDSTEIDRFTKNAWEIYSNASCLVNSLPKETQKGLFEHLKKVEITSPAENEAAFEEFQKRTMDIRSWSFIPTVLVDTFYDIQLQKAQHLLQITEEELNQSFARKVQTDYLVPTHFVPSQAEFEVDNGLQFDILNKKEELEILKNFTDEQKLQSYLEKQNNDLLKSVKLNFDLEQIDLEQI